jgi:hypothetical protein
MNPNSQIEMREVPSSGQIVPTAPQGLAVRSASLVARGLRDLARDSNWLIKKVFTGPSPNLTISPKGEVCAVTPLIRHGAQCVVLYDVERSIPTMALSVPGESSKSLLDSTQGMPAAFAWSWSARYLVGAWAGWPASLHLFDLQGKMLVGMFGAFERFPQYLAWSGGGRFFAAVSSGGKNASVRVWETRREEMPFSPAPSHEMSAPSGMEVQAYGEGFDEEIAFKGYGRTAFSPDEGTLAVVAQIQGEWADDSILLAPPTSLQNHCLFQGQGHITDLSWTPDSCHIIYCAAGQAYRLLASTFEFEPLPFGAELCACHPQLLLCLCFSSWLKNSAKGRLFLVDLKKLTVFDEYAAEGVVDLRWNLDGSKAFAITESGMAYIYDPPLL